MKHYFGSTAASVTTILLLELTAIAMPIAKLQHTREIWFYIMSAVCC